jgi:predicted dehydrogenase
MYGTASRTSSKVENAIGFGVIGTGLWGRAHAEVYATNPYSRLVAVCDLNKDRAEEVAAEHGAKAYTDIEAFLANPDIKAVGIATPDTMHREPAVLAAEAGKHILLEKPLATTQGDIEAIADSVARNKVRLMVDFHARWSPPIVVARDSIRRGELGDLVSAYYRLNDVVSVPLRMLAWAAKSSILWFLGSHTIDTLRWLLDDEVEWVHSVSRSGVLKAQGVDVPDIYQTLMKFRKGVIATIENNWIVPNTQPNVNDIKLNVLGSKGMIDIDLTNNGVLQRFVPERYDQPDVFVKPQIHDRHAGFAYAAIHDFVERLFFDEDFITDLRDGINVSKTILAIMKSAESNLPVTVDL